MTIIVAIVVLLAYVGVFTASILKGRGAWWLLLAALIPPLQLILIYSAFRLATPGSWWARRFYDQPKLEASRARYPVDADLHTEHVTTAAQWTDEDIEAGTDRITRRALKKAGRL